MPALLLTVFLLSSASDGDASQVSSHTQASAVRSAAVMATYVVDLGVMVTAGGYFVAVNGVAFGHLLTGTGYRADFLGFDHVLPSFAGAALAGLAMTDVIAGFSRSAVAALPPLTFGEASE